MKRAAVGGAVAAGVLAVGGGTAHAVVEHFDITPTGDDGYVVLNSQNNEVAPGATGPRVAFVTEFRCTDEERIGMGFLAFQDESGEDPAGVRGITRECNGNNQDVLVVVQKAQGTPNFDSDQRLDVYGIAATDLDQGLNDIDNSSTWTENENGA